ncbi:MAG TPA: hypothetical protein VG318_04630 [Actinomycetota bacterium]|nr:hypothetical protein [Actinomycetota bacterium]
MRDLERDLTVMLEERARRVAPPADGARVLRRARRRRAVTAGTAVLVSIALISGAFAGIGGLGSTDPVRPATDGDEDFTQDLRSTPGEYPHVATGTFRGVEWDLRAAAVRRGPGSDVRLTFAVSSERGGHSTSGPLRARYGTLVVNRLDESAALDPNTDALWGVARPGIERVDVEVDDGQGTTIPAHLFTGHDSRTGIRASYWVAFVPRDANAYVVARDRFGTTRARHELGHPTPPRHEVTTGRSGDTGWSLSYVEGGTGTIPESRRGEVCLSVTDSGRGYAVHCIERDELRVPLYLSYLDTENARVVAGILGRDVVKVRLRIGSRTTLLPVMRVADDRSTTVKLVAVGAPPEGRGRLEAIDRRGRVVFGTGF